MVYYLCVYIIINFCISLILEQVLLDLHTTIKFNYKRILVAAVDLFNFFITSLLVYLHLFGAINFYYNILKYARTCFNFNSNAAILLGLFLLRNIISCSVPVLAAALTMVTLLIVILNTTFFRSSAVWSWCYINIYFGFFGHPEVYYFNITWHSVFISAIVSYLCTSPHFWTCRYGVCNGYYRYFRLFGFGLIILFTVGYGCWYSRIFLLPLQFIIAVPTGIKIFSC